MYDVSTKHRRYLIAPGLTVQLQVHKALPIRSRSISTCQLFNEVVGTNE